MEKENILVLDKKLMGLISFVEKEQTKIILKAEESTKLKLSVGKKKEVNLVLLQVVELFKSLGGTQEKELLNKLEKFISYGLFVVFGEEYRFVTEMGLEGKDLKVDFYVQTGDLKSAVASAKGGGVAEVVSLLLQLFFLVCQKGELAPFLLLDTAMVNLSELYYGNMSRLLKEFCTKLGLQILLLTHSKDYGQFADKVYYFTQENGKTIVEEEK